MKAPTPLLLARELSSAIAHLRWGIGGSLLLHHLGLDVAPRDLDIVCVLEDFEPLRARLIKVLGEPSIVPHISYVSIGFARFEPRPGIAVDLMAGIRVRRHGGQFLEWHFDPRTLTYADGLPWMRATDWVELYEMFDRPEQAKILRKHLGMSESSP